MALAELLDALRSRAAEQRAEELARAQAEAARIRAESSAALERRRLEWVERTRRVEMEAARRALARAEKDAARSVLAARDRLLARVADALHARAATAASDADYLRALPAEVRGALDRLPAGSVVVRVPAEILPVVVEAVRGRDGVVVEAAEMDIGFVASTAVAGVEIDGRLATRVGHAWPRLAVTVLLEAAE